MIKLLNKASNWKLILPLFIAVAFLGGYIFPNYEKQFADIAGEPVKIFDLRFSYDLEDANVICTQLRQEGRTLYKFVNQIPDSIYPLAYGGFFILVLAFLLKRLFGEDSKYLYLALFPAVVAFFDFMENFQTVGIVRDFPELAEGKVQLASTFTQLKWITFGLSVTMVVLLGGILLVRILLSKMKNA